VKVQRSSLLHHYDSDDEGDDPTGEDQIERGVALVVVLLPGPGRHREVVECVAVLVGDLHQRLAVVLVIVVGHAPHSQHTVSPQPGPRQAPDQ